MVRNSMAWLKDMIFAFPKGNVPTWGIPIGDIFLKQIQELDDQVAFKTKSFLAILFSVNEDFIWFPTFEVYAALKV